MTNGIILNIKTPVSAGVKTMSILMGIFMNLSCIGVYLFPSAEGGLDTSGMLGIMYLAVVGAIFVTAIYNKTFSIVKINRIIWVPIIGILLFYYYSITHLPEPRTPFNHFIVFTIVALLIPTIIRINTRLTLLTVMVSTIPALLQLQVIFFSTLITVTSDDILSQGYSYAFLTPVVCAIIYLLYYYKNDSSKTKTWITIIVLINLLFSFFLITRGSRGPIAALVMLVAFPYVLKADYDMNGIKVNLKKFIILALVIYIVSTNFIQILTLIQSIFSGIGLSFHFVDKFLIRNELGDITSERDGILEMAMNGFYAKPFFGNGFDQFMNNTGRGYPHNFIAQILYDGGLYLFTITLLPVLFYLRRWFKSCNYNEYIIIVVLLFSSVPGALVSFDMWEVGNLWLFMGACLNYEKLTTT